jgi:hypothetical protein
VTNLPPVTLTIQVSTNGLHLAWPAGVLQSSGNVTGPYTNVTGAMSPYTVAQSGVSQFFRVKVR